MISARYICFSDLPPTGKCYNCGGELTGRQTKYCSSKCSREFYEHNDIQAIKRRLIKERGEKCEHCGEITYLELHHLKPISQGGELFNDDNLILLCHECHKLYHKRLRAKTKQLIVQDNLSFE